MTKKTLHRMALVCGILCIVLAGIILVYADGLRRWYSGLFFTVIGTVMLLNALHGPLRDDE